MTAGRPAGPARLAPATSDPDTGGFFAAAARGEVALRYCAGCGALLHLPLAYCWHCGGWETEYRAVAPRARVYSWTVVEHQIHPAYPVPYTVALVELSAEPPARLVTHLPGRPALYPGQELEAWFEQLEDGTTLVQWRPAEPEPGEPEEAAVPVAEGLFTWPDRPRLIGSTCAACSTTTFPAQRSCPRCTGPHMREVPLVTTGRLWTWTIQAFEPKPPYAADGPFTPYGVGYVELATEDGSGAVLVESRLTEADPDRLEIGAPMRLTFIPLRRDASGARVMTYAFEPVPPAHPAQQRSTP